MAYEEYETALPRITVWEIENWRELADVHRVLTTDRNRDWWWRGREGSSKRQWERIELNYLRLDLNEEDPFLAIEDPAAGELHTLATGSCCVYMSSNGTGFIGLYRLKQASLPPFLFYPSIHLLP